MELKPNWTKNLFNWILNKSKILAFLEATLKSNTEKYFKIQKLNRHIEVLEEQEESAVSHVMRLQKENEELNNKLEILCEYRNDCDSFVRENKALRIENNQLLESNSIWIKQHETDQKKIKSLTTKLKKLEKSIILKY